MDFVDANILAASCGCCEGERRESEAPGTPKVERGFGFLSFLAALIAATLYVVCRVTWRLLY